MTLAPQFKKYLDSSYNNLEITSSDIEIEDPPTDSSHTTRMELEELEDIISEAKLPPKILRVADRDPLRLFYSVAKKKGLDPLEEEAKEWADDWTKLSFEYKLKFKRRRPYEVKKEHDIDFIVDKSDTSESPSYPSGHAMMGYGVAEFYKDKYPLMADEWDNVAEIIAHSRLQMGVHYPSDTKASKEIVEQLAGEGVKTASLLDLDELFGEDGPLTKVASYANFLTRLSPKARAAFRQFRGRGNSQTNWVSDFNKWVEETGQDVRQVFSNQRDSRRYSAMNSSAYQDYVNYTTQNRGATYGDWRRAGGSRGGTPLTLGQVTRNKPAGYTPPQVKSTTNTAPKSPVTVSSNKSAPGQGVSSISQPMSKASPAAPATAAPTTAAPATPQTLGQRAQRLGDNIGNFASQNPMQAGAAGVVGVGGVTMGIGGMRKRNPANKMPKLGSLGHLEQRRSERAKFMSKEDLAALEKQVRRTKDLPEGAHYITLPHGRKGVVRTEEGKSHLASILDARMRPPGRDISSKVKTAAEKLRLYHGSPHDLETLEPRQPNKGAWGGHGLYGTPNQLVAALYAIARNDSRGSWGILPDGRLIAKSKKELNPEGYVYEYDSDDYIPPPEDDPGIGYASQSSPEILSKEKVYLDQLRDSITRVDDRDKFLEYFKKTSSPRLRTTIFGVDPEGNLLHGFGNQGFYKFPGGGVDPGESIVDAAKRELLEEAGYDVESIEELPGLDTSDSVGATSAKGHMGHGSSLTKYLLARLGKRNESLLGSEGDAISNLQTAPIDEVLGGLEGDMLFGSGVAESNHAALSRVRDMLQKTSSEQPLLRHRSTLLIRDPETGKLLAANSREDRNFNDVSPFYFPGGGLYEDEYDTPRTPTEEEILEGARREALEELGMTLKNPKIIGGLANVIKQKAWRDKALKNRGVPYEGGHEHLVLADKGDIDNSLYNIEGDAFTKGEYYDPQEVYDSLAEYGATDGQFAPYNREQARAIKDNLLKKASDLSVLTAVPKQNLDLIMRKGLASQKAISEDPEMTEAFLRQRGLKEEDWRKELSEALKGHKPASRLGPSVFFSEPDPDKVSDPRHFINQFDTTALRINLGKLLKDIPETRFHGVELEPFNEEAWEADPDNYPSRRHRDLTTDEIAALIAKDPKELWKDYKDEYIGKYYAADVPHAQIVTPNGIIPPEYLERVEKTSSAKEQLKHILVTGHSGAGKTTYARQLAEQLGIPLHRLDVPTGPIMEERYPNLWDQGTLGFPEDVTTDVIQQALDLDTPHVIEGSHILEIPELTEGYKRILIDTPEDRVVEQRAQREYRNQGRKNKPYRPIEKHREAAKELVDHYRDIVTNFRNQPGVESIVPEVKTSSAYADMSPEVAAKLREALAKKKEYQKQFDAPEDPSRIYHGSPNKIDKFETRPHYLADDEPVVFGTPSRTQAISFLAPWLDSDFEQGTYNGDPTLHMTEQYPGAFEKIYKGRKGYMYELDPTKFEWGPQLMRSEFMSKEVPEVLDSEELDVYEAMLAEEAAGRLKLHRYKDKTASDKDFAPDLTPDDLKALGVYDQVYGDAPSEASMKEWPEHWINKQDPLGWLQWYDRYSEGRRTDDDERQMKRWKSFKARHLAQYLKKPTPRRAAALRNWGIDVEKY